MKKYSIRHLSEPGLYSVLTEEPALHDSTDALLKQTAELASRIERIEAESLSKSAQVTLLSEVGRALQSTMEIDQLL